MRETGAMLFKTFIDGINVDHTALQIYMPTKAS